MTDGICGGRPWQEIKIANFYVLSPDMTVICYHQAFRLWTVPVGRYWMTTDRYGYSENYYKRPGRRDLVCPKPSKPDWHCFQRYGCRRFLKAEACGRRFQIFWDNALRTLFWRWMRWKIGYNRGVWKGRRECRSCLWVLLNEANCFPVQNFAVAASPIIIDIRSFMYFATIGYDK